MTKKLLVWLCLPWLVATGAAENQLNLFIYSEYIDPEIVAEFEREHQCKVVIDLYEDEASMMAKLQGGGSSLYDVVVPPDYRMPALIKLGFLAPLRHEALPNLKNIDPKFLNPPYDPGNRYSIPYQWGTLGIFVRKTSDRPLPETWGLLFDPGLQPERFLLIDAPRDLIGAALKYRGHSLNSSDPSQLREARDLLLEAKRRCVGFDSSVGGKNKVLGRLSHAAMVFSGEAARGMRDDPETTYIIPKEGSEIWQDNLVILAKAPHPELAERFLNFLLDARIGARLSNYTQFATPNRAARPLIDPKDLSNPAIYPPPDVLEKLEFLKDLGSRTRLYDEIWTQIKAR